jgi:hypothetical protein
MKSFASKLIGTLALAALGSATLLAPLQASANNCTSMGQGVKCCWVLVSYDPETATSVYEQVCRKGV